MISKKLVLVTLAGLALSAQFGCSKVKLTSGTPMEGDLASKMNAGPEIAKVNSSSIHQGYIDMLSEINPRLKAQLSSPDARKQILASLVDQELLYQASVKQGLDQAPDVKQKIAYLNRMVIAQSYLENEMKKKARETYEEKKDSDFTKIKIAQIMVQFIPDEEAAKADDKTKKDDKPKSDEPTKIQKDEALKKINELRAKAVAGEDFAKLAEENSDDKITKKRGGDMGSISKTEKRFARIGLDNLAEKLFTMKKDEITEPVESKRGYHIFKVLSEPEVASFEEAEKMIRFQIQKDVKDTVMADLRKDATIEMHEDKLDGGTPPAAVVPASGGPLEVTAEGATQTAPPATVPAVTPTEGAVPQVAPATIPAATPPTQQPTSPVPPPAVVAPAPSAQ